MSGSPEEINNVLDVINRTEYMRGYNARNEELKKDPARLNIEINHGYYNTGYLQGVADTKKRYQKAFEDIRADIVMYKADSDLSNDDTCRRCGDNVFGSILRIIDAHNPDKVGKEREDKTE